MQLVLHRPCPRGILCGYTHYKENTMTRKHFESIAYSIRYMTLTDTARREVAERMADTCALHNSRFDRDKFLAACGV